MNCLFTSARVRLSLGLLGMIGILFGTVPAASGDAFDMVVKAMRAKATGTYQGQQTIIWSLPASQGGGMMEIITAAAHDHLCSRMTYLFPPDAAGRVMTDDSVQTSLYEPQQHTLLVGPSAVREAKKNERSVLSLLRRNYTFTVIRRERLNGRQCAVVAIRPRLQEGPYKLCWIDQARPFFLRLEEYDREGCRRYVSDYNSISFPASLPAGTLALPPAAVSATRRVVHQVVGASVSSKPAVLWAKAGFVGRLPAYLPQGYMMQQLCLLTPAPAGPSLIQMRCSDGMQTMTITECKADGSSPPLAALNSTLGRYGQQAWVSDCPNMRIVVRGDLSLPPEVGAEMARAFASSTEQRLARAFGHQFGPGMSSHLRMLRQEGWDYVALASAALFLQKHPQQSKDFGALLGKEQMWPLVARRLHANVGTLKVQARAWIKSVW